MPSEKKQKTPAEEDSARMESCVKKVSSVYHGMKSLFDERNKLSEYAQSHLVDLFEIAIERMNIK